MTFQIDTGDTPIQGSFGRYEHDDNFNVDLSDWVRADRFKRQTIHDIWGVGDIPDLDGIMSGNSHMLDALFLAHPDMWDEIKEHEQDCRAGLLDAERRLAKANADPAEPGNCLGIKF